MTSAAPDWFAALTGFSEDGYETTRARLSTDDGEIVSTETGRRYQIGELSTPTLAELRTRAPVSDGPRTTVRSHVHDIRTLHSDSEFRNALFQVPAEFNLLQMPSPQVPPEAGVTCYAYDDSLGPACAIAVGPAAIYRNYLVPVGESTGQTEHRQIDTLEGLRAALARELAAAPDDVWRMRNGYPLCTAESLEAITRLLIGASEDLRETLRGSVQVGVHRRIQVTDPLAGPDQQVSQVLCPTLPVNHLVGAKWELLARLALEAVYEATLLFAAERAGRGESKVVLLCRAGGGPAGNAETWIDDALSRALGIIEDAGLDVRLPGFGTLHPRIRRIVQRSAASAG